MSSNIAIGNHPAAAMPKAEVNTSAASKNVITDTAIARAAQIAASKMEAPKRDIKFNPEEMRQSLQEAVSFLNSQVSTKKQGLGFQVDSVLGRPVVTVKNTSTGEVIRQIPNEEVVRFAHNLESMKGLFHNSSN